MLALSCTQGSEPYVLNGCAPQTLLYVQMRLRVHQWWRLSAIKVHIRLDYMETVPLITASISSSIVIGEGTNTQSKLTAEVHFSCASASSCDHFFFFYLLVFFCFCFFFCFFFLSLEFHELWCSVMSTCLITEIKQQWAVLVLGWVIASVNYSCLPWLCGSCW